MNAYAELTRKLNNIANDNANLENMFLQMLDSIGAVDGYVKGIYNLRIFVKGKAIKIFFVGYEFQLTYKYSYRNSTSYGVLFLEELLSDGTKISKGEELFNNKYYILNEDYSVSDRRLRFDSKEESLGFVLNMLHEAIKIS